MVITGALGVVIWCFLKGSLSLSKFVSLIGQNFSISIISWTFFFMWAISGQSSAKKGLRNKIEHELTYGYGESRLSQN